MATLQNVVFLFSVFLFLRDPPPYTVARENFCLHSLFFVTFLAGFGAWRVMSNFGFLMFVVTLFPFLLLTSLVPFFLLPLLFSPNRSPFPSSADWTTPFAFSAQVFIYSLRVSWLKELQPFASWLCCSCIVQMRGLIRLDFLGPGFLFPHQDYVSSQHGFLIKSVITVPLINRALIFLS